MAGFDPELLRARHIDVAVDWTAKDTQLYALGVGAEELPFVYERGLTALPTMAVVLGYPGFGFWADPALGVDTTKILHGETEVILHRPLPPEGRFVGTNSVLGIYDKGADKGCVVRQTRTLSDGAGTLLATVNNTSFLRGNGGFGGSSEGQPAPRPAPPERAFDESVAIATLPAQSLLYRLSGDYNALHIDPEVAKKAGFDRPILHGLCTFGIVGRAIVRALCGNDPAKLKAIGARFSAPVYPGETIVTEIWRTSSGHAAFRARVAERDLVVLNNGYAEFA
ncbi:MAG: MaoC family dehydratase N-terminal domain-containing protein [Sphingomonadaceae bacterium]|nr:MaoC family dehydratase N-terminal domain-containing protein [Sphingomonadaceae bacterium]